MHDMYNFVIGSTTYIMQQLEGLNAYGFFIKTNVTATVFKEWVMLDTAQ